MATLRRSAQLQRMQTISKNTICVDENQPEKKYVLNFGDHTWPDEQRYAYNLFEKKAELFEFDPNMLSKDSLELLGIGSYAASNIVKYREKGGKFDAINDYIAFTAPILKVYRSKLKLSKLGLQDEISR